MNRLVHGDVGCGKTVVALAAMLTAVENGCQACLMAPTELLAEQHFINIHKMVEALGLKVVNQVNKALGILGPHGSWRVEPDDGDRALAVGGREDSLS